MKDSSPISVCHLSTVHAVNDIRIFYKECRSLQNAGFEVTYIASHDRETTMDGVRILPLPFTHSRLRRIFLHTWLTLLKALKLNARLYHIHDPELLPIAWILRFCGKKVIYDAHEHLSKDILDKPWIRSAFVRKLISSLTGAFEQLSASILSGIVAATNHIASQFDPKKTALVRNFPMLDFISEVPKPPKRTDGKRVIVYTGGLTRIRGILQMVEAMRTVPDNLELVIAGQWEDAQFENECRQSPGWQKCTYLGHVPQREAYGLMKGADAGILTFLPAANHMEAMPNKAFEYMACDLPMIISDFPYWRELFGESAVYVDPTDPGSIAKGIISLFENQSTVQKDLPALPKFNSGELSWEAESRVLIGFYNRILQTP